ncbi:MAG: HD-GYP domain-containing protein [Cyanobacteria bacterium M_surface_10_m2_119]|nr:HD-GYP domain-containing protein [Cyanobacteria bacterium M_surface_10_m2_119]
MVGTRVGDALGTRLRQLHEQLLELVPDVDRIACVLYDPQDDLLKIFVDSTRSGEAIKAYEFRLAKSDSLSRLASSGSTRVLDDIPSAVQGNSLHSIWLLKEGYRSSLTVPLYDKGAFIGFLFYDSRRPAAFTAAVQRNLSLFSTLINMTISNELNLVRSITTSAQVAREFANLRDFETGGHLERMAHYARLIARDLQESHGLSDEFIEHLYLFAPLHDIGKIGIPDSVLLKPGRLDPEERQLMETHVGKGVEVLEKLIGEFGLEELPDSAVMRNVVAGHHECLDGSGYPLGLKGEAIPLEARIIAVADVLDALTSHRPYKEPWSFEDAVAELERLVATGKFDADCVAAVKRHRGEVMAICDRFQDR